MIYSLHPCSQYCCVINLLSYYTQPGYVSALKQVVMVSDVVTSQVSVRLAEMHRAVAVILSSQ